MRRSSSFVVAVLVLASVPASAGAQIVFDDGYDPDSPAGKQYSIPAEKVVEDASAGRIRRSGTKTKGGDGPLFGIGLTAQPSVRQRDKSNGRVGQGRPNRSPRPGKGNASRADEVRSDGTVVADAARRAADETRILAERSAAAARAAAESEASSSSSISWLLLTLAVCGGAAALFLVRGLGRRSSAPAPTT